MTKEEFNIISEKIQDAFDNLRVNTDIAQCGPYCAFRQGYIEAIREFKPEILEAK